MECWKNINHLYSQAWEVHNSWHFWRNKNNIFLFFRLLFGSQCGSARLCSNFKSQVGLAKVSSAVNIRSSNLKSHNAPTTTSGHTALRWPAARIEKDLRCWVGLKRARVYPELKGSTKIILRWSQNNLGILRIAFLMEKNILKSLCNSF